MNPNIDKLPVPNTAPAGVSAQGVELGASAPITESAPSQEVSRVVSPQAIPPTQVVASAVPSVSRVNPIVPAISNIPATASPISDFDQEFEKKWINTAKAIVERTKGDPHMQSQELSKIGEEYRKRLGRRVDPNKE